MSLLKRLQKNGVKVSGAEKLEDGCMVKRPVLKKHAPENVIDDNPISITGTIVSHTGKDKFGGIQVYIVPWRIDVPKDCTHVVQSPSGNVYSIATARQANPESKKELVLHMFAPGIVPVNCPVMCIDFPTSKSGPSKRDIDPDQDLTPGRQVQFYSCVAYCRKGSVQQRFKASSVVFLGGKVSILNQKREIFRALKNSKIAQQTLALMYARRTGYTSEKLFLMTVLDCQAIHSMVTNVLNKYETHEISGPLGKEAILPPDARTYMEKLLPGLEKYAIRDYRTHLQQTDSSVGIWAVPEIGKYHIPLVPLFSFGEFNNEQLDVSCLMEFSTDQEHFSKTMEEIEKTPPPVVGASVSAIAIMEKDSNGTVHTSVPHYKDAANGSSVVLHPYSIMVRLAGETKNIFGIYSPLLAMVVAELWSRCDQIFVLDEMTPVSNCHVVGRDACSTFQPALETSFGPKESCVKWDVENVVDVYNVIRKYGVPVSKDLVKKLTVDTFGSTMSGAGANFKAEHYEDKANGKRPVVPIVPPTLLTHGYWCINGKAGLTFEALLHQVPEGCNGEIEFYAVFKGCAAKVEDDLYVDDEAREAAVLEVAKSQEEAQKRVAFYAVAKPCQDNLPARLPEASEVPAEPTDSEMEPPNKKAKVDDQGDTQGEGQPDGAPHTDDDEDVHNQVFGA